MYPNDPFSQPSGVDYLNQIASPAPPQSSDKKTRLIIIAMIILGVLSLAMIFMGSQQTSKQGSPMTAIVKIQRLQHLATKYDSKLKRSDIQTINSSLLAVLLTANRSIENPALSAGIDLKKQAKEIQAKIATGGVEQKLDEAYLNTHLDSAYTYTINTEIADALSTIAAVQKTSSKKDLKSALEKIAGDLTSIHKQLTALMANQSRA